MLEAELKWLRSCLAVPNGAAVEVARDLYAGSQPWLSEYERRQSEGLDPLVNLDGSCYGSEISKEVVREQWAELMEQYPEKIITKSNLHLVQSFSGRSLLCPSTDSHDRLLGSTTDWSCSWATLMFWASMVSELLAGVSNNKLSSALLSDERQYTYTVDTRRDAQSDVRNHEIHRRRF